MLRANFLVDISSKNPLFRPGKGHRIIPMMDEHSGDSERPLNTKGGRRIEVKGRTENRTGGRKSRPATKKGGRETKHESRSQIRTPPRG